MSTINQETMSLINHYGMPDPRKVPSSLSESEYVPVDRVMYNQETQTLTNLEQKQTEEQEKASKALKEKVIKHTSRGFRTTLVVSGLLLALAGLLYHFGMLQLAVHAMATSGNLQALIWQGTLYGGILMTSVGGTLFAIKLVRRGVHRKIGTYVLALLKSAGNKVRKPYEELSFYSMKRRIEAEKSAARGRVIENEINTLRVCSAMHEDINWENISLAEGETVLANTIFDKKMRPVATIIQDRRVDHPDPKFLKTLYDEKNEWYFNLMIYNNDNEPIADIEQDGTGNWRRLATETPIKDAPSLLNGSYL